MKNVFVLVLISVASVFAQKDAPVSQIINFLPPALDAQGQKVAFGSTVSPDGTIGATNDLYVGSTKLVDNVTAVGISSDGSRAVYTNVVTDGEGVATVDTSTHAIKQVTVDKEGCVRPQAICPLCFYACVVTPHATADGSKILYAVRRNKPFYVVNADGTGLVNLPTYSGSLAPAPQRVISAAGRIAFTSAAPSGPTFAAAPADVFLIDLDGSNLQNVTRFGIDPSIFAANAAISGDGTTVVFESNFSGGPKPSPQTQVWVAHLDGSKAQLSTGDDAAVSPSISADGKAVVFAQSGVIKIVKLADAGQPQVQPAPLTTFKSSTAQSPAISDDGLHVTFLVGPPNSSAGAVYEINSDGTGLTAIYAPRAISPEGVVSAAGASLQPSPGGIFSVYGINFASDAIHVATGFPLPDELAGASVKVNGVKVPVLSVSPWQINALLPQDTLVQSCDFQVSLSDGTSTSSLAVKVAASAPDLFLQRLPFGPADPTQAAAFHAGTGILADAQNPARAGETLELYGTGLGITDPMVAAGVASPADTPAQTVLKPKVQLGEASAEVIFAGLAPGYAGLYQINIVIPGGLGTGHYLVNLNSSVPNSGRGTIVVE